MDLLPSEPFQVNQHGKLTFDPLILSFSLKHLQDGEDDIDFVLIVQKADASLKVCEVNCSGAQPDNSDQLFVASFIFLIL